MAMGSTIGSTAGTIGGAAIGGPVGAAIGGAAGGIIGGFIDKSGEKNQNVPMEDPNQVARLKEIQDTRKQISEGRDPLTKQRISSIKQAGETTKGQLGKFTGGDVGGTISSMLRAQRNVNQGTNQAFTQSQQRLPFFQNLESQLGTRIAQRKLELGIHSADQAAAESANTNRQIIGNVAGLAGSLGGVAIGGGQNKVAGGGGTDSLGQFNSPVGGINPNLGPAQPFVGGTISGSDIGGGTGAGFGGVGAPQTGFQSPLSLPQIGG